MHFYKLIKSSVCATLIFSLTITMGSSTGLSRTMSSEKQLAGLSVLVDENDNHEKIMKALPAKESVSGAAIHVGDVATATGSAIEVKEKPKKSKFANRGLSIANDYVCVRSKKSTDSKIVGKLYKGSIANIIDKSGKWVKVTSGSVKGYVRKDYLAIGKDADKVSKKYAIKKAKVETETLMVRKKKSTKSKILDLVGEGDYLKVLKNEKDWVKIRLNDDTTGYVSADYVKVVDTFKKAEKVVAPQKRTVIKSVATSGGSTSTTGRTRVSKSSSKKVTKSSGSYSSTGSAIASYALDFVGNPYVYGGTSLTNGADCSGFVQSVFRKFGISLPRTSRAQSGSGRAISVSEARAGDLVFYAKNGSINHVAICIGGGRVVHASSPSTGIKTSNLYYRTPVAVRRLV